LIRISVLICRLSRTKLDKWMDATVAALLGAVIGGLLSVLASWLAQRVQSRSQLISQEIQRRQLLYSEFVQATACCYADALQENEPDPGKLASLYGLASNSVDLFADFGDACRVELARLQMRGVAYGPSMFRLGPMSDVSSSPSQ
jgi:hypothetical protein